MENPETIEIEGLKTIHKLCKFADEHNMEGCTFTEIVERMFSKIEKMKAQVNTLDEMLLNQGEALAKAQAVPEWISVEDSLPKKNANVLLNVVARRRGKPFSCIGFYSVEPDDEPCFILDDNFTILKGVTHWMPLPDAPQEPAND